MKFMSLVISLLILFGAYLVTKAYIIPKLNYVDLPFVNIEKIENNLNLIFITIAVFITVKHLIF